MLNPRSGGARWAMRVVLLGICAALSGYKGSCGTGTPGFDYRQVKNTKNIEIGGQAFHVEFGLPADKVAGAVFVVYRITRLWNDTDDPFTFHFNQFLACTNAPIGLGPGISDTNMTKVVPADTEPFDVDIPLVIYCQEPDGSHKDKDYELTYPGPPQAIGVPPPGNSGVPPFEQTITKIPK